MSDPSGLRAGVERLIAEWEADAVEAGGYCCAVTRRNDAAVLRALLVKHPPTAPEKSVLLERVLQTSARRRSASALKAELVRAMRALLAEQHRLEAENRSLREAAEIPQQAFTQSAREIRRLEKALEAERQRRAQVPNDSDV